MHQKSVAILVMLIFLVSSVWGGGFALYEFGGRASAMGGATVAQAVDPSTIFYNPAGLAFLKGTQFYGGTTLIFPKARYVGPEPYPWAGEVYDAESQVFTPIGVYISHKFNERLGVGIGITNPFGLGLKWSDDFPGKYFSKNSEIRSFYISPVVAYQISPHISLGGGLDIVTSQVILDRYLLVSMDPPNSDPGVEVGTVYMEGTSKLAVGFTASILARSERVGFGLSYRHRVINKFEDATADFTIYDQYQTLFVDNLGLFVDQKGSTEIPFPGILTVGMYFRVTPKLGIELDYNYYTWSIFQELVLDFENYRLDTKIEEDYRDSYTLRLGAHYELNDNLSLRAGYIRDKTPQPTYSVSPILPDNDRNNFSFGFGYSTGKLKIDAGYMFVNFGTRSTFENGIPVAEFNGSYASNASLIFFSFGYAIR